MTGYTAKLPLRTNPENAFQKTALEKGPSTPNIIQKTVYYDIWGQTVPALRSEMATKGVLLDGGDGKRKEAATDYWFKGRKFTSSVNQEGKWVVHSVEYDEIGIIETYPNWQDIWKAPMWLREQFHSAVFQMRMHEQRHVDTYIGYLLAVKNAALEIPPQPSKEALAVELKRVIDPIDAAHEFAQNAIEIGPILPSLLTGKPPAKNAPKPKPSKPSVRLP